MRISDWSSDVCSSDLEIGEEAPEISIELYPPNASAMATLCNPNMQGSQVSIFVGAVDPTSGLIIGQPEVKFLGEIDVPSLTIGEGGQIGRAQVCTPVTNAQLVCRLLLEQKNTTHR